MAIEHIDWLIESLCSIKKSVTFEEYDKSLVEISSNKIVKSTSKTRRTIEMYLYWLTTLELVSERDSEGKYHISHLGKKLCKSRKKSRVEYKRVLKTILLRNKHVGSFFKKYVDIIEARAKNK